MNDALVEILKQNALSITDNRLKILSFFQKNNKALSHADIEKLSGKNFDRVTIYRTLQTFVEKGIIHTIPTSDNSVRYALCKDCKEGEHVDDHVHFVCKNCNKTFCLDDVVSPKIDLPEGYVAEHVEVIIYGLCKECV